MRRSCQAAGPSRLDFGLDAPPVVYGYATGAVVGVALIIAGAISELAVVWGIGIYLAVLGGGFAGPMVYSSKIGKVRVRNRLLDRLALTGGEDVLDLACGSGLMLVGDATRLGAGGHATGIDLWRSRDQAGSNPEPCLANARLAGVEDRVTLRDGDITNVPFPDASFDLVLASLTLHNLHPKDRRRQAVREAARVLRPGERLALIDIAGTRVYINEAKQAGLTDTARSSFVAGMWPPARVVIANRSG